MAVRKTTWRGIDPVGGIGLNPNSNTSSAYDPRLAGGTNSNGYVPTNPLRPTQDELDAARDVANKAIEERQNAKNQNQRDDDYQPNYSSGSRNSGGSGGSGSGGNGSGGGGNWSAGTYRELPDYTSAYQDRIDELLNDLMDRQFSYDYTTDPLYQQYERSYTNNGQRAMEDTLGRLAARTGGLASSYAGSAAQQAYNNYMSQLSGVIPELQQIAYQMYLDDYNNDYRNLNTLIDQDETAYQRYLDTLDRGYAAQGSSDGVVIGGGSGRGSSGRSGSGSNYDDDELSRQVQAAKDVASRSSNGYLPSSPLRDTGATSGSSARPTGETHYRGSTTEAQRRATTGARPSGQTFTYGANNTASRAVNNAANNATLSNAELERLRKMYDDGELSEWALNQILNARGY